MRPIAWIVILCAAILLVTDLRANPQDKENGTNASLEHRWVYAQTNLQVDENVPRLEKVMERAAAAGYNGVLLADFKFHVLDRVPDRYFANVRRVRERATELKLDIIPAVMPIGYSEGLLTHDPNLAEGLPVRDQLLVVDGDAARLEPDPPVKLEGGDFEAVEDHKFAGWDFQDLAGRASFADRDVKHGGECSLRMRNVGTSESAGANCRVMRRIEVAPFRPYHLSVWIKTREFGAADSVRMFAMGNDGRVLSHSNLEVKPTQDWTRHDVVFNSLNNDAVRVYAGVWGGKDGTLWMDDMAIEEVAFVNLLRRPGCPLAVALELTGAKLRERYEFDELKDPGMGVVPWSGGFDVFHEPPTLRVKSQAALRDGDRLRVSYYHAVTIYSGQVACCLTEPAVFDRLRREVTAVERLLEPKGFMMSHDEIRVAGWCAACQKTKRTPGQLLADNAKQCVEIIRQVNPRARVFVWSDMFDPAHNAVDGFYLVNGSLAGSCDGLPPDVTIVNWNFDGRAKSLPFFAQRGHRQILAGYYDGDPRRIADWLRVAGTTNRVAGAMYTTWQGRYDALDEFARAGWGEPPPAAPALPPRLRKNQPTKR